MSRTKFLQDLRVKITLDIKVDSALIGDKLNEHVKQRTIEAVRISEFDQVTRGADGAIEGLSFSNRAQQWSG